MQRKQKIVVHEATIYIKVRNKIQPNSSNAMKSPMQQMASLNQSTGWLKG